MKINNYTERLSYITDKMGNPNTEAKDYIEIIPLPENQIIITYREYNDKGKSIIVSDEKYRIVQSVFGERSEENKSTELIGKIFNLESHKMLEKVQDEK
jgi:hypothetical protein